MPIYLDYHSHAPIDPRVLASLMESHEFADANPHSTHLHGTRAHGAVENARSQVAKLLSSRPSEVVFTSGATESNNLAFRGVAKHLRAIGRNKIVVSAIEHASVLAAASDLCDSGFKLDIVPVDTDGIINKIALDNAVTADAGLVSIAAANHEIGTLQPVEDISALVRSRGAIFHSDLSQLAGKLEVSSSTFDMASFSAHKLSGPLGIGALFVRRLLRPKLSPFIVGGGQESGLRSGTLAAPLSVAFGTACEIAMSEMFDEAVRVTQLRDSLLDDLLTIPGTTLSGTLAKRLPGNINLAFEDVDGEALVFSVRDQLSISTGSACNAKSLEPSHVLRAIGLSRSSAECSIRIGIGRFTTVDEIKKTAQILKSAVNELRAIRSRA